MNITFIGGGNMASALIGGLLKQGFAAAAIHGVEIDPKARARLAADYGIACHEAPDAAALEADIIVLAVKPQQLRGVAAAIAPQLKSQLVISIAAGVRAADLSRWLHGYARIVRAMPNTPALVRAGITGLYALPAVSAREREEAQRILGAVGECLWVEDEPLLDAVTAVSGSGPAYVFYFMEALEAAAVELGLSEAAARALALATFLGAARLASQSDESPATLRARVTSKGGTTERALASLEQAGVKAAINAAVKAAAARAKELGDELGAQA